VPDANNVGGGIINSVRQTSWHKGQQRSFRGSFCFKGNLQRLPQAEGDIDTPLLANRLSDIVRLVSVILR
jgi:hypothetical protein